MVLFVCLVRVGGGTVVVCACLLINACSVSAISVDVMMKKVMCKGMWHMSCDFLPFWRNGVVLMRMDMAKCNCVLSL